MLQGRTQRREEAVAALEIRSDAFEDGGTIPRRHTCDAENVSPALSFAGPPEGTRSLALVVDDPDAPVGTFVHWLGWGIDPAAGGLVEGQAAPREGRNGFGTVGYAGPCPPPGHGRHRYFFRLHALDAELGLEPGADRGELERALDGHVLEVAELVGGYER
jgi:Raf kinase inhibitor-like YbhB/YbcL family protein